MGELRNVTLNASGRNGWFEKRHPELKRLHSACVSICESVVVFSTDAVSLPNQRAKERRCWHLCWQASFAIFLARSSTVKAEKRFLGMGCHGLPLAGHPSSRRAAMHASLVDAILSPKSRSNASMVACGGPLSRTFRLGKPKLTKLLRLRGRERIT